MRWEFDAAVTATFERELEQSIPGLSSMRWWNDAIGEELLRSGDLCVDVGCSIGSSFDYICRDETVQFWGIDNSAPMIERARMRFLSRPNVSFDCLDASRLSFPRKARLTLCVLSLQFMDPSERRSILRVIQANSEHLLLVEKTTVDHDELITRLYYDFKREMGVSEERIQRKRVMLEDVLVPLDRSGNEEMLRECGFSMVSTYWANGPFVGWIAS